MISCNDDACGGPYNAPVAVRLSADDGSGSGVAQIRYTTDGSTPTANSGTVYTAPFALATTTTVKYLAVDNAGNAENPANSQLIPVDTTAPTVSLTAPADGATVTGTISLTANASDNGGRSITSTSSSDGNVVGSDDTSPYSFSWNSTTVPDGAHAVAARAVDTATNQTTSTAANVTVSNADTTPATSTIECNGAACAGPYSAAVDITLSATDDPGGSGVAGIYYTTDGTDPTSSTGTPYITGFVVPTTTTVKFRAYDNAGNAEPTNSQLITIDTGPTDTTPPTSTIECNGAACAGPYSAAVNVTLSATDDPGGSGVAGIRYTTDGTDPTARPARPTPPRSPSRRRRRSSTAPSTSPATPSRRTAS